MMCPLWRTIFLSIPTFLILSILQDPEKILPHSWSPSSNSYSHSYHILGIPTIHYLFLIHSLLLYIGFHIQYFKGFVPCTTVSPVTTSVDKTSSETVFQMNRQTIDVLASLRTKPIGTVIFVTIEFMDLAHRVEQMKWIQWPSFWFWRNNFACPQILTSGAMVTCVLSSHAYNYHTFFILLTPLISLTSPT